MNKNRIAFIVEGNKTEPKIIKNLCECVFTNKPIEVITLSAGCNIYQVWLALKGCDFNADVIEIIHELHEKDAKYQGKYGNLKSENFGEVYLFFDYDGHQHNLPKLMDGDNVIQEMLQTFDNETELGKLIISYPMAESIRDYSQEYGICYRCAVDGYKNIGYKEQTKNFTRFQNTSKLTKYDWNDIIEIFLNRCRCLLDLTNIKSYVDQEISPDTIFKNQQEKFLKPYKKVMVLSGFAEFLVEYYGRRLFDENNKLAFLNVIN